MALKRKRQRFVDLFRATYGKDRVSATRQEIVTLVKEQNITWPAWLTQSDEFKSGKRGQYLLPVPAADSDSTLATGGASPALIEAAPALADVQTDITLVKRINGSLRFIPDKMPEFVAWGHFKDISAIVSSRKFFPVFITGLSGNGKTLQIEQVAAKQRRELFRVNITCDTDEDDLLGGFRLINGETVFVPGPAVEAMERGALLLLDEIDLATAKIMCLQPILEGKGVFLKKVGQWVKPQPGFNIIATANTKGQGNENGKFVGTNVLNEAMLDRFPVTFEQPYPSIKQETKILAKHMESLGIDDDKFRDCLVRWAADIRKTYEVDDIDEVISTRRLVNVLTAYSIYDDKLKAIKLSIARFDSEIKTSFLNFYTKIDEEVNAPEVAAAPEGSAVAVEVDDEDDIPF